MLYCPLGDQNMGRLEILFFFFFDFFLLPLWADIS